MKSVIHLAILKIPILVLLSFPFLQCSENQVISTSSKLRFIVKNNTGIRYPVTIDEERYFTPCTLFVSNQGYYDVKPDTFWTNQMCGGKPDTVFSFNGWEADSFLVNSKNIRIVHDTEVTFKTLTKYKINVSHVINGIPDFQFSQQLWCTKDSFCSIHPRSIPGFEFKKWLINNSDTCTDNNLYVKINSSFLITGFYDQIFRSLNISTNADTSLQLEINGAKVYTPCLSEFIDSSCVILKATTPQFINSGGLFSDYDMRYDFQSWQNDKNPDTLLIVIIAKDTSFKALYKKSLFVEFNVFPADSSNPYWAKWFPLDTVITVQPVVLPKKSFKNWVINGVTRDSLSSLTVKISEPKSIIALYDRLAVLSVLTEPNIPGISIKIGDSTFSSSGKRVVPEGTNLQVEVGTPLEFDLNPLVDGKDVRYTFVAWDKGMGTNNSIVISVDSSMILKAKMKSQYKFEMISKYGERQFDTNSHFYPADTTLFLSPHKKDGFVFSHWVINNKNVYSDSNISIKINAPNLVESIYKKTKSVTIKSNFDSMAIIVNGWQQVTPYTMYLCENDSATVSVSSPVFQSCGALSADPNVRYIFKKWIATGSTDPTTILTFNDSGSATFIMHKNYLVQISVQPPTFTTFPQNAWFPADTTITLTAPYYAGYFFSRWEVDAKDSIPFTSFPIFVNQPRKIKALYHTAFSVRDVDSLLLGWKSILGDDGPAMLDKLVSYYTPDCRNYTGENDILSFSENARKNMISSMKLDPNKPVLSDQIQRTFADSGYTIEVHRLEIVPGIYLAANIYLPMGKNFHECPLVVMAPGCESNLSSEYMQNLAGNLSKMGMVVLSADGFCNNGNRGSIDISSGSLIAYARELIGLPCPVSVFIQEVYSLITWAINTYTIINPSKIGCTGYSHGGGICQTLSQVDKRISCISIPATQIGNICGHNLIVSDIWIQSSPLYGPDFRWSAPSEIPLYHLNSEFALLFPVYIQTTCGENDWGASVDYEKPAFDYAKQIYTAAGYQDRISFNTDVFDHNYNENRRENTYSWFDYVFNGNHLQQFSEKAINLYSYPDLEADLSGSSNLINDFESAIQAMKNSRFVGKIPNSNVNARVNNAMNQLFGDFKQDFQSLEMKIEKVWKDIQIRGYRFDENGYSIPITVFKNLKIADGSQVLYLPKSGTIEERDTIASLLNRYASVVSIDYFGIGELKSDRVMLMTYAAYFMNSNPSLPKMIVNSLRSYMRTTQGKYDVIGNGWAASFFASCLKYLESEKFAKSILIDIPDDEFEMLASHTNSIPHFLLWNGLFSKISVTELDVVNKSRAFQ
jgi:hypothetical protein